MDIYLPKEYYLSILAALLGVLVGAILNHWLIIEREKKKLRNEKQRLIRAFWSELEALFKIFESVKLRPWNHIDENIHLYMLTIEYDYLNIFNSNADKIGIFKSEDASELLKFYIYAKSFIDTLRELADRRTKLIELERQHNTDLNNIGLANFYKSARIDFFKLYQIAYNQQVDFYKHFKEVKKTFDKLR